MSLSSASVRQDADHVELHIDGRSWRLPAEAAEALGRGLLVQSKLAEQYARRDQIIADQALLIRAGAPFGVTSNRKMQEAAKVEAQWGSALRRAIRMPKWRGVVFGAPSIKNEV